MAGTPVSSDDTENPSKIKEIVDKMKQDVANIYPDFEKSLLWERPMAWKLVEAVVKEPGLVWKQKMPHQVNSVKGLFFVGDFYGQLWNWKQIQQHIVLSCVIQKLCSI